jgi:hypothetical protein
MLTRGSRGGKGLFIVISFEMIFGLDPDSVDSKEATTQISPGLAD